MKLSQLQSDNMISIDRLNMSTSGVSEAIIDIAGGRPSKTTGPIHVLKDLQLTDGYHRVVQAMLGGIREVPYMVVPQYGSYPTLGQRFKVSSSLLMGLEYFVNEMDDDQLANLMKYPNAAAYIKFHERFDANNA